MRIHVYVEVRVYILVEFGIIPNRERQPKRHAFYYCPSMSLLSESLLCLGLQAHGVCYLLALCCLPPSIGRGFLAFGRAFMQQQFLLSYIALLSASARCGQSARAALGTLVERYNIGRRNQRASFCSNAHTITSEHHQKHTQKHTHNSIISSQKHTFK